ncbi:hypothetical protein AB0D46_36335 [Streptomyces sp. NPDC048383]|uniref:hypothetical protein n=1 Tax=Streptomyces sp. NPDC048383 TaxID=3155386 RepID=UPI0034442286
MTEKSPRATSPSPRPPSSSRTSFWSLSELLDGDGQDDVGDLQAVAASPVVVVDVPGLVAEQLGPTDSDT